MALLSSTLKGRVLKFHSGAVDPRTLFVVSVTGQESISGPYCFRIELVSRRADLDLDQILESPAYLAIKQGVQLSGSENRGIRTLRIHGILSSFEEAEKGFDWVIYRAVLVPRLWRLSLNTRNRVFLNRSVPEIVEQVLREAGFGKEDFDLYSHLGSRGYPMREYTVQYQESDLNFLSRLLEHEGISYYFTQEEEAEEGFEKIVFTDQMAGFGKMAGDSTLRYRPAGVGVADAAFLDWFDQEAVSKLRCRSHLVQQEVVLHDRNYRKPGVNLKVRAEVEPKGFGAYYEYGAHYKDPEEGATLAKIRAQEIQCRRKLWEMESSWRAARAGFLFDLTDHFRPDFNREYLVTEVRHWAEQTIKLAGPSAPEAVYRNSIVAVPSRPDDPDAKWEFRPSRHAHRPRVAGSLYAEVDATGEGEYAELDDQGRLRAKLGFDLEEREAGNASRPIRTAQPYVGPDYGMHFPIHKKAEVLVTCVNGDPDRPVISAGLHNPASPDHVVGKNQTQGILKSAGNNALLFEDQKDEERVFLHAQRDLGIRTRNDQLEFVGNEQHRTVESDLLERVKNDRHVTVERDLFQKVKGNRHLTVETNQATSVGGQKSLYVETDDVREVGGNQIECIGGDSYRKAGGIVLEADSGITLKCGDSYVVINPSGVTVKGATIALDGSATLINSGPGESAASGTGMSPEVPAEPKLPKEPGTLEGGGKAKDEEPPPPAEKSWISIELRHKEAGTPYAGAPYKIVDSSDATWFGRLDKEGKAKVEGVAKGKCQVMFPRVDKRRWKRI